MSRLERRIPFPVTIHLVLFSRNWNQLRNFEDIEKKRERTVQFIWQTRSLPSVVNLFHWTKQGPLGRSTLLTLILQRLIELVQSHEIRSCNSQSRVFRPHLQKSFYYAMRWPSIWSITLFSCTYAFTRNLCQIISRT